MRVLICFIIYVMASLAIASGLPEWDVQVEDVTGRKLGPQQIRSHVTALSFSTRGTRTESEKLGQYLGQRFGARHGYQSVALINTSTMPFWMKPFAGGGIESAYTEAVDEAIELQKNSGNSKATKERVQARMYFVHDKTGDLWKRFGAEPEGDAFYFGILDSKGRMVYLARNPKDFADIGRIMDRELTRLETTVSRK